MSNPILRLEGGRELRAAFRKASDEGGRQLSAAWRRVAQHLLVAFRPLIRRKTSRLEATAKVRATQTWAAVQYGNNSKVLYAGSYEFGGHPPGRPFVAAGRFLFPEAERRRAELQREAEQEMDALLRKLDLI